MNDYLSEGGRVIFDEIKKHCEQKLKWLAIDYFELSMLANSFYLYAKCAKDINENGVSMTFQTEKGGTYEQIRPEYTVMKTEYANILKHSAKFGLNQADRDKL